MITQLKNKIIEFILAGAIISIVNVPVVAAEQSFKMDTTAPGSTSYVFSVAVIDQVSKHLPYEIQLSSGKVASRSAVDAAKGNVDFYIGVSGLYESMKAGSDMFAKLADAPEMHKKLRALMAYTAGAYHFIVYEESGIKTLHDIKGKKVFIGPRGSIVYKSASELIEIVTGYKPNKDYEVVFYDWNSGMQAFQDKQMDMYVGVNTVPNGQISQLTLSDKIRLLGVPEDSFEDPKFKAMVEMPGKTVGTIPAGIYGENQTNEKDIKQLAAYVSLGTHVGVSEEAAYNITKAIWENFEDFSSAAPWLKSISRDTAFEEMVVPLHLGAYRYYKEAGFDIPDYVVPPEVK